MNKPNYYATKVLDEFTEREVRDPDVMKEIIEKHVREAMKDAMNWYAWWKDGVLYVGTTGKTLKKALEGLE